MLETDDPTTEDEAVTDRESRWANVLNSKAVVALITAVFAALIAPTVTWIVETKTADREFNSAWLKARGDQALQSHLDSIVQKRQIVEQIASGIDRVVTASRALVTSTTFPDQGSTQVAEIQHEFNEAEKAWNRARLTIGFRLLYYSGGNTVVEKSWRNVEEKTYVYIECVSGWHDLVRKSGKSPADAEAICGIQSREVVHAMATLGAQSYTNLDAGWNTPDDLKKSLGIKN